MVNAFMFAVISLGVHGTAYFVCPCTGSHQELLRNWLISYWDYCDVMLVTAYHLIVSSTTRSYNASQSPPRHDRHRLVPYQVIEM
jgi:hypothetical protein